MTNLGIVTVACVANIADVKIKKIKTIAGSARFVERTCMLEAREDAIGAIEIE